MKTYECSHFGPLTVTSHDLTELREEMQCKLKKIEEISSQINKELGSEKGMKWWQCPREVLLKGSLQMMDLKYFTQEAVEIFKKAEKISDEINNESFIYRIIHKIKGVL